MRSAEPRRRDSLAGPRPGGEEQSSMGRRGTIAFSLLFAVFAFLHLYRMASLSPTWDEGTDLGIVQCLHASHDPFACLDDISQTRLPFYIHAAVAGFTPRIEAQYAVSLIASAMTLLMLWTFARREFGEVVAIFAAALYVTSPQLLASGRMLMTHANILFTMFTTSSIIAFYYVIAATSSRARSIALLVSAVAFGLATACSILGVFNGIVIALLYATTIVRERRMAWIDMVYVPVAVATFFATTIIYLKPANLVALIHACTLPAVYPFWNYLELGSPHAPWYFSLVLFAIKIGPWWIVLTALLAMGSSKLPSLQRSVLGAFAVALCINFALKGFVFQYDAPHHQVQFYPLVYLAIAAICVRRGRRSSLGVAAIALCFAIQIYYVVRFFPNYLFYGSQYGGRFIGEFYGPAVMHAQDRGPVNAHIDALLANDRNVKILVADHNALERPEPNFVAFTKRDPSARYEYVFVDRLYARHLHLPERDEFNRYVSANYVDDYTYEFPIHVWMYKVMKRKWGDGVWERDLAATQLVNIESRLSRFSPRLPN